MCILHSLLQRSYLNDRNSIDFSVVSVCYCHVIYRLCTVNDFHWEFKPVLSYSQPHTFSTPFGEEKRKKSLQIIF